MTFVVKQLTLESCPSLKGAVVCPGPPLPERTEDEEITVEAETVEEAAKKLSLVPYQPPGHREGSYPGFCVKDDPEVLAELQFRVENPGKTKSPYILGFQLKKAREVTCFADLTR